VFESREFLALRKSVSPRPFANGAPGRGKRLSINPWILYGGFAALVATNALTLVGLLMAPDISRLVTGKTDSVLAAYEDRIFELRLEVDRLQSRHYAQAGDINLQLQDLAQTQELLLEQHQYVRQLAERAAELGIEADVAPPAETPPVLTGARAGPNDPAAEVAEAAANVDRMMTESRLALATLSDEATTRTDAIMDTLAAVGIRPKLPSFEAEDGVGGPLLPPIEGAESSTLVDDANAVAEALERYRAARGAVALAPVHKPIKVATRTSSTFGNRKDPFTGRLAFHSGIDYAAPRDSTVLSAGAGTVSFVGQISGYGNVVEIDHGNGLITRYGHLNSFIAKKGQRVSTGTPIARVGSTGRSTGPHLHFEVRRADSAVDPARYLKAGQALQKILAG